jgi:O-antigen biosynthesis protein
MGSESDETRDNPTAELERLRARVAELESLEHRAAYLDSAVRQLREQADAIVESGTWRLLAGAGRLVQRLRRAGRKPGPACAITDGQYHRWLAECDRREVPAFEDGPRFSIVMQPDERTRASLARQCYGNWEEAPCPERAAGDYVVAPQPGDELSPDALYLFARAARDGADLVYCDEDALDGRGLRTDPWFKPGWSPDLLAVRDYIGRAMAFRRELGGGAARDLAARAHSIVHVPRVLYHRRGPRDEPAQRVRYVVPPGWHVDILVPSRNPAVLARCLESVQARTACRAYSLTVIDNSDGKEVAALAQRFGARYVDWRGRPFNYSAMNNAAAAASEAPALLFLNDDTTVIEPGWLEAMAEHAARPEVGAVGAKLLYPDGRIQHAGVAIGIFGVCGHLFKGGPGDGPTYQGLGETVRNVSAVTGACLMTRAEVFRDAGGFDEERFPVAYNDIDLCLRILSGGRRVLYTPHAVLHHHEAYSKPWRQRAPSLAEIRAFQTRWTDYIRHDPFYNPNLTRADESCGLRSRDEWS